MKMESFKRQTAFKFWIGDILNSSGQRSKEGFLVFAVRGKTAIRVNVMANIIDKYENDSKNYSTVTLDDGSGQIRAKAWNEDTRALSSMAVGSCALIVGKLALSANNELYIRPEIAKALANTSWQKLRELELKKEFGKPEEIRAEGSAVDFEEKIDVQKEKAFSVVEDVVGGEEAVEPSIAAREKIFRIIEKCTEKEGAKITDIIEDSGLDKKLAEEVIQELLQEGEIFQPRPGRVQVT